MPDPMEMAWAAMDSSGADTMQMLLYAREGDAEPFRMVVLVNGADAVARLQEPLERVLAEGGETL